jgi:prolyl oligopeptidase
MKPKTPPAAPRDSVESQKDTEAADPFRPLEDSEAPAVQAWIREQQIRTREFLDSLPGRDEIENLVRNMLASPPSFGVPIRRGRRRFYLYNDGNMSHPVWMVEDDAGKRVLIDPAQWFGRDTDCVGAFEPSPDGRYVAYTRRLSGGGYTTLHVHDVDGSVDLPDTIERCRLAFPAWVSDGQSFLYSQLPPATDGISSLQGGEEIRIHRVDEPTSADRTVFVPPDRNLRFAFSKNLPDGSGFVLYADSGETRYGAWIVDQNAGDLRKIADPGCFSFEVVHKVGSTLFALTDHLAHNKRVVAFDVSDPAPDHWRTVIAETESVIEWATFIGGHWLLCLGAHGFSRIQIRNADGSAPRFPSLPEPAVFSWPKPDPDGDRVHIQAFSLLTPGRFYSIDTANNLATTRGSPEIKETLADCVATQTFVAARDGVKIPLTLVHKRDLVRDGATPTLLYGYGAFGRPATHGFSLRMLAWVRSGGVYAIAHTRGGGEEGKQWHEAAMGRLRHVAHQDFSDCAEWLIREGYCKPSTLGIHGTSAGGLLVATTAVLRPDLFGAAVCHAAPTDMVRHPQFSLAGGHVREFGNPEDPEDLSAILTWSPLHNVRPDVSYPAMLISTGLCDELVAPVHSFKFAAALQQTPTPVVLLRIQENAGHSVANTREQTVQMVVDQHVFLWNALTS